MYIAKLPLDTSRAFEVINVDDFKREALEKLKKEMPDDAEYLNDMVEKQLDKLFEDGYKEFIFSDKPEAGEGEKEVLSFEEIDNRIYQRWTVEPDVDYYLTLINEKKAKLAASDYKIIKCQEAQLVGNELPYDIEKLSIERQALRDEINDLEKYIEQ